MNEEVCEGQTVLVGATGSTHWIVESIESRIDPLGVVLKSGLTGVHRRETFANLIPFARKVSA